MVFCVRRKAVRDKDRFRDDSNEAESDTRGLESPDSSGNRSSIPHSTSFRPHIVLKLPRDIEFVPKIAAERVQIVVLLLDLHHRLSILLLALKFALSQSHSALPTGSGIFKSVRDGISSSPPPFSHTASATFRTSLLITQPTFPRMFSDRNTLVKSAWYRQSVCSLLPCVRINTVF